MHSPAGDGSFLLSIGELLTGMHGGMPWILLVIMVSVLIVENLHIFDYCFVLGLCNQDHPCAISCDCGSVSYG